MAASAIWYAVMNSSLPGRPGNGIALKLRRRKENRTRSFFRLRFAKALTYFSLIRAILLVPLVPFTVDRCGIVVLCDLDDDRHLPNFLACGFHGPDRAGHIPLSKCARRAHHRIASCHRFRCLTLVDQIEKEANWLDDQHALPKRGFVGPGLSADPKLRDDVILEHDLREARIGGDADANRAVEQPFVSGLAPCLAGLVARHRGCLSLPGTRPSPSPSSCRRLSCWRICDKPRCRRSTS